MFSVRIGQLIVAACVATSAAAASAQPLSRSSMPLRIGDEAPNFTAQTTQGPIDFHAWIGNGWAILFSHPKDFTPVCTTELGYLARIKSEFMYPMTTGRNFDEVLRVLDSIQLTAKHRVATPANWKQGDDVIISGSVSDDEARKQYPEGWKAPRPYLRIVHRPGAGVASAR